ncbi:zinc-ribbon domain-containing protein [bacterium]|nr:zinc-ribbon domain-containing protein [bacterium]
MALKKEPKTQGKHRTKYAPDELEKMLAKAQGRSLAESEHANQLVPEFDKVKNHPLTPWHVTQGSSMLVYWSGKCGYEGERHKYQNSVAARVIALREGYKSRGCKLCSTYEYPPVMPIRKYHRLVAKEWMEKENGFLVKWIDARSQRCGLFQCIRNSAHIFRCMVRSRTGKTQQGCPYCYKGKRVNLKEFPEALQFFDRTKNNRGYSLGRIPFGHNVFWRCSNGHRWYCTVSKTIKKGCRRCSEAEAEAEQKAKGKRAVKPVERTLASVPELKSQYRAALNSDQSAESILLTGNSGLILTWVCTEAGVEHVFEARLHERLNGSGCRSCAKAKNFGASSLASKEYKHIADEINRLVHPEIDLATISASSRKKLSFVCKVCQKTWITRIDKRCMLGQGCSSCKAKTRSTQG